MPMPIYSIFGDRLRSEIAFPELRSTRANGARWTLRIARTPPAANGRELLGSDAVMPGVNAHLYKVGGGYRLAYDDTGTFEIAADGRDIVWSRGADAQMHAARLDIMGRVLPLSLHASGLLCLHGSAVCLGNEAIAFLAPPFHGKSTLAITLADIGARIMTDDALAVELGPPVIARPGVHSVRLLADSARAVVGDARRLTALGAYPMERRDLHQLPRDQPFVTKQILRGLPASKLMFDSVPLAAIYLLCPMRPETGAQAATRAPLPAVRAALSLVKHAKSGVLLGKSEAPVLFDRAVSVARHVPVYLLEIVRDLARIRDAAEQIAHWHR